MRETWARRMQGMERCRYRDVDVSIPCVEVGGSERKPHVIPTATPLFAPFLGAKPTAIAPGSRAEKRKSTST